MANTQVFTGQNINQGFQPKNHERSFIQNRPTQIFKPNNEIRGTDNTANVLLIDVSASMDDPIGNGDSRTKLDGAKDAVCRFIGGLPRTAYFSLVAFSDNAIVVYPMSQMNANKIDMTNKAQKMKTIGCTDMAAGLKAAEKELQKAPANLIKRVFGLTDGMSQEDPTGDASRMKANGIQITTIGFGESQVSLDEDLLRKISSVSAAGDPLYYYINNAQKLTGFMKRSSVSITQ